MNIPKSCGHGKTFKQRCIECELVSAREGLATAKEGLDKYNKLIVKLEAEQVMQVTTHLTQQHTRTDGQTTG